MITLYHNPRCRKSREAVQALDEAKLEYQVRLYLTEVLTKEELEALLKKLAINPEQLIRKGEAVWKQQYKGKQLSDVQLIDAMVANPKLIERPILEQGQQAVVGRPIESVYQFIGKE